MRVTQNGEPLSSAGFARAILVVVLGEASEGATEAPSEAL